MSKTDFEEICRAVRCPVLVVHGDRDGIIPYSHGGALAELLGVGLVTIEDGGHLPSLGDPVRCNLLVREFVASLAGTADPPRTWTRALRRRRRALYVSSPIGLGHVRRDIAIADELRALQPDLEIDWLAQHPITEPLAERAERVHPASRFLANESAHIESEAGEHDLHVFQAYRRMDEILLANFMVFHDLVTEEQFDLVVADEGWDLDYFLHENPELKRSPFAWLTDFVGWLPMADGGPAEAGLTADYNAEMVEQVARYPALRDLSIFVGDRADLVPDPLGPGLPSVRDWTEANFDFAGYVTGYEPATDRRGAARRAGLPTRRTGLPGRGGRVRGGGAPAAPGDVGVPGGGAAGAGTADDRRGRAAHRPALGAGPRRGGGARLRARPVSRAGRVRHRRRAGRADHDDGAGGRAPPVPLLPPGAPLRAADPRRPPARRGTGPAAGWTTPPPTPRSSPTPSPPSSARPVDYLPVATDGARRAARLLHGVIG